MDRSGRLDAMDLSDDAGRDDSICGGLLCCAVVLCCAVRVRRLKPTDWPQARFRRRLRYTKGKEAYVPPVLPCMHERRGRRLFSFPFANPQDGSTKTGTEYQPRRSFRHGLASRDGLTCTGRFHALGVEKAHVPPHRRCPETPAT
ncbi:hypothetical protein LZ32DRAFT_605021 [Colletotrichum eremochloae]|nr:hypothetical protein LZ32DRAFT_605021 [Colletotrichum eremochloae]